LFVFQLINRAVLRRDVIARPEVDGLVDCSALPVGVEVADFDHSPHLGNGVVGRDGDVAGWSALAGGVDKFERHASPSRVRWADDEGGGLDTQKETDTHISLAHYRNAQWQGPNVDLCGFVNVSCGFIWFHVVVRLQGDIYRPNSH
jgi:hypothetical protein